MPAKKRMTNDESRIKEKKAPKGVTVDLFDIKGAKTTMTLPKEVFGVKINKPLLAQAVRVYLANQRAGTAKAKTRGEVQGSTRKIYQQKGTGRARHGGIRAPIFVGGGVAHGPRPHTFSLSMPKKMRKQALFCALSSKKVDDAVSVVKGLDGIEAKTKAMVQVFKNIGLAGKKNSIMVVLPTHTEKSIGIRRSCQNIAGVSLMPVAKLNAYDVLKAKYLLFMQEAISELQSTN